MVTVFYHGPVNAVMPKNLMVWLESIKTSKSANIEDLVASASCLAQHTHNTHMHVCTVQNNTDRDNKIDHDNVMVTETHTLAQTRADTLSGHDKICIDISGIVCTLFYIYQITLNSTLCFSLLKLHIATEFFIQMLQHPLSGCLFLTMLQWLLD